MKIGTRLFVALAIPLAILIAAFAVLEDRANRMRDRDEVTREGHMIARAIQIATANALRDRQLPDVLRLIDDVSGHESVLAVRLFDPSGHMVYAPSEVRLAPAPAADEIRKFARTGTITRASYTIGGQPVVAWLAPLTGPQGDELGAVQVLQLDSFVEEHAVASSRAIAAFAAILVGAVALIVLVVSRVSVARPIEGLVASVRRVGDGVRGTRVPVARDDELGRLAQEFNGMCQRLEQAQARLLEEQVERERIEGSLRDAERLASLGRFAAGIAHEIGTPLNVIGGRAESLRRRGGLDAASERSLAIIAGQIERITRIVQGVLEFARVRELRIAPTDLKELIGRVVELVEDRFARQAIALEITVPPDLDPLAADADQLQQVFLNLALNAADAMPQGGRLRIAASRGERVHAEHGEAPIPCVIVAFEDTGVGIAPEHLARVFEPFFTTKEIGSGTGLGLAISYGIVREHGGWIAVENREKGSRFSICLPAEM